MAGERAIISGRFMHVPLVYIWRRGQQVLYVGSSMDGLGRPTARKHHILGWVGVNPEDEIECIFFPRYQESEIRAREEELIRLLKPCYNIAGRAREWLNNEAPQVVRRLVEGVSEKKGVHYLAFAPKPESLERSEVGARYVASETPQLLAERLPLSAASKRLHDAEIQRRCDGLTQLRNEAGR